MRFLQSLPSALLVVSSCVLAGARAQGPQPFVDPETGILFSQYSAPVTADVPKGGFQLGVAFPPNLDKNEYIGHLVGSRPQGKGWVAISHAPQMLNTLILVAWVQGREVQTSFRYATNYTQPDIYVGALSFSQLAHTINKTHFTVTYRCQGCFAWNYKGQKTSIDLKGESVLFGWGQGSHDPSLPGNNNSPIDFHDNGFGVIAAIPSLATNPKYDSYANVAHSPKNIGQPKISSLDPKLAGNRTSWPTGTKSNQGPPPTYTPGQISVAPPRPAKPTGGAPGLPAPGTQNGPQPLPQAAPVATPGPAQVQNGVPANKPGYTTITGNWEDDAKNKRQVKAIPSPNACPSPQIPKHEDDRGAMPAVLGVPEEPLSTGSNHGNINDLPPHATVPHRRQLQESSVEFLPQISAPPPLMGLEPPKLPVPTSTGSGDSAQIPPPADDLGLFPKMSGVPNKPPVIGRIECGSLYEVQGNLRYIC